MSPKDTLFYTKKTLNVHGRLVSLETPKVMGIINVTPDSFHSGSRYSTVDAAIKTAGTMLGQGATFLDIGGYSTRPDAAEVSASEEIERVIPAIAAICKTFPEAMLSIDTFRAEVAEQAIGAGAGIINDISGGTLDTKMFETVAKLNVPYILMHMRGTPQTMKTMNNYENLIVELVDFFQKSVAALVDLGVKDVIIDPGFGFAKNIDQNYELLRNLHCLKALNLPILAGISRKSMIYRKLGVSPEDGLNGTTVLNTLALAKGAAILRVHDVKEAAEAIKLYKLTYP